jgi:hypothetical protein
VAGDPRRRGLHEIRDVLRARTPTHLHLRDRLAFVLWATVVIDAVASVLVLLFERNMRGTEITNIGGELHSGADNIGAGHLAGLRSGACPIACTSPSPTRPTP